MIARGRDFRMMAWDSIDASPSGHTGGGLRNIIRAITDRPYGEVLAVLFVIVRPLSQLKLTALPKGEPRGMAANFTHALSPPNITLPPPFSLLQTDFKIPLFSPAGVWYNGASCRHAAGGT